MTNKDNQISAFTDAPERQRAVVEFSGMSGEEAFEIMGDPDRITDWYLLAKEIHHHEPGPDGEARFNVEFTFFGDVFEEVLHWDPPHQYIYKATGGDFPIKDYIARIAVDMTGPNSGRMSWTMHFNNIEGREFRRILPVILHPINEQSMHKLAGLLGGKVVECTMDFSGLAATA